MREEVINTPPSFALPPLGDWEVRCPRGWGGGWTRAGDGGHYGGGGVRRTTDYEGHTFPPLPDVKLDAAKSGSTKGGRLPRQAGYSDGTKPSMTGEASTGQGETNDGGQGVSDPPPSPLLSLPGRQPAHQTLGQGLDTTKHTQSE